jgi:hypothetical protein
MKTISREAKEKKCSDKLTHSYHNAKRGEPFLSACAKAWLKVSFIKQRTPKIEGYIGCFHLAISKGKRKSNIFF